MASPPKHAHEAADTGFARNRPFFNSGEPGALFFVSSGFKWRPATEIAPAQDQHPDLRLLYEKYIQGRQFEDPLQTTLDWLEGVLTVLGVDLEALADGDPRDLP